MYGQFKSSIVSGKYTLPCRSIILPLPPVDINDAFLNSYYSQSKKPTTLGNMHNRWIHASCTFLKKGRHEKIKDDVTILAYYISNTNSFYSDDQFSDIMSVLEYEVIELRSHIRSFVLMPIYSKDTNVLFINVLKNLDLPLKDLIVDVNNIKECLT